MASTGKLKIAPSVVVIDRFYRGAMVMLSGSSESPQCHPIDESSARFIESSLTTPLDRIEIAKLIALGILERGAES